MRCFLSTFIAVALISAGAQAQLQLRDLSGLTLEPSGSLSPAFDVGTANYTATVAAEHVVVRCPVVDHATVTLAVDGVPLGVPLEEGAPSPPIALEPGMQRNIDIVVGAFPYKKQYRVTVSRPANWELAPHNARALAAMREAAADDVTPQQIKLALGRTASEASVTWITAASAGAQTLVRFGSSPQALKGQATGPRARRYSASCSGARTASYNYTSGYIHKVRLQGLPVDSTVYYAVGGEGSAASSPVYSFRTLPDAAATAAAAADDGATQTPSASNLYPFAFGAVGDMGQTDDSIQTVQHLASDPSLRALLHAGDMSYADCDHHRWDTWGYMVQNLSSTLPWMVCPGNHEVETDLVHETTFAAYKNRFAMPEAAPENDRTTVDQLIDDCTPSVFVGGYDFGNAFYSFEMGPATVVVLSPYTSTGPDSPQYKWLQATLSGVDRGTRPWLFAMMHGPWYNSNTHHHNENNTVAMRGDMEDLFHKYDVNAVLSGHVHAYERTHPVYRNQTVSSSVASAPVYFNIGDGGNREGHNTDYLQLPEWTAFRDGDQFGHARLELLNDTHANWSWQRNADGEFVSADRAVLINRLALRKAAQAERHLGL